LSLNIATHISGNAGSWKPIPGKSFLREIDLRSATGQEELLGLSGSSGVMRKHEMKQRTAEAESYIGYKQVRAGQLVSNKMQAWNGLFGIARHDGIISPDYAIYEFFGGQNPKFIEYIVRTPLYRAEFLSRSTGIGTGFMRLNPDEFLSVRFWLPEVSRQDAIVGYLDRETSRIEALVERKFRFIELLKEKRTALINRVVTKGLNPEAPMKESGVDWLGKIPAHWEVVPPIALFNESKERAREGDELLSATQKYGVIPLAEFEVLEQRQVTKAVANLELRKHVEVGDFVISMRSMDGGLERARAVGSVRSSYSVLKCGPDVEVRYFGSLLKSVSYIQALKLTSNFIRDGQDMNFSHFRKVRLPKPAPSEQAAIANYIESQSARIDALIAKTERSARLLKERKSTLIEAAVTGKISIQPIHRRSKALEAVA
jgi:type I restriction enzyme S subunit